MEIQVPELWDKIAGYCSSPYTLRQLSLVARFMKDIAQSYLFQHVEHLAKHNKNSTKASLDGVPDNEVIERLRVHRSGRSSKRFQALASSPLATFVRTWKYESDIIRLFSLEDGFSFSVLEVMSKFAKRFQTKFVKTLPSYSRLQSLNMAGLILDDASLSMIDQLKELEALNLSQVIMVTLHYPHRLKVATLRLDATNVVGAPVEATLALSCDPQYLHELTLSGRPILVPLLASLIQEGNWPNLTRVNVTIDDEAEIVPIFFRFLEGCQTLADLIVRPWEGSIAVAPYPSLSRHACPNLAGVTGPAFIIHAIVPGRPVTDIGINELGDSGRNATLQDFINALNSGSQSTGKVEELTIMGGTIALHQDLLPELETYFPELATLSVSIDDSQQPNEDEDGDEDEDDSDSWVSDDEIGDESDDSISDNSDETVAVLPVRNASHSFPTVSKYFPAGYPKLMAQIALGLITLPWSLQFLEIQTFPGKRTKFGRAQQRAIMVEMSQNERFDTLYDLTMGSSNKPYSWKNPQVTPNDPDDVLHGWIEIT